MTITDPMAHLEGLLGPRLVILTSKMTVPIIPLWTSPQWGLPWEARLGRGIQPIICFFDLPLQFSKGLFSLQNRMDLTKGGGIRRSHCPATIGQSGEQTPLDCSWVAQTFGKQSFEDTGMVVAGPTGPLGGAKHPLGQRVHHSRGPVRPILGLGVGWEVDAPRDRRCPNNRPDRLTLALGSEGEGGALDV